LYDLTWRPGRCDLKHPGVIFQNVAYCSVRAMVGLSYRTCYVPFAICARLQTGTSHLLPVEHKRALYKRDANGTSRLFSVRLQCPFAPLARVEQTGTPPGHKREVPVCIACKFRADKFFRKRTSRLLPTRRENAAQGDSTCGERRISLALAGVGAHFCHVATSSLPKIRRAVPICVADANGQGPVCAETHLRSSTNERPAFSLSTTSARPKRDRSRRAAWGHKRDTIVRRRGARAQTGTLHSPPRSKSSYSHQDATFTYANGHFGVKNTNGHWQRVPVCKRALGTNGT
jgi:hypothetical protein